MKQRAQTSRLPTIALGVIAGAVLLQLLIVSSGGGLWLIVLFAPIYAAYVTAAILVLGGLACDLLGRRSIPFPLLPARWNTQRKTYLIVGAVVVLMTLLREGAFAPGLTWGYDSYRSEQRIDVMRIPTGHTVVRGEGAADRTAGRPVHCALSCSNDSFTCASVLEQIRCDSYEGTTPLPAGAVEVQATIAVEEPDCYFPLYNSSRTRFSTELTIDLHTTNGSMTVSSSIDGTVEQEVSGPISCRSYRRHLARGIATGIASALRNELDAS